MQLSGIEKNDNGIRNGSWFHSLHYIRLLAVLNFFSSSSSSYMFSASSFSFFSRFGFALFAESWWMSLSMGDGGHRHTRTLALDLVRVNVTDKTSEKPYVNWICTYSVSIHRVECAKHSPANRYKSEMNETKRNRKINLWNYCPTFFSPVAHTIHTLSERASARLSANHFFR